MMSEPSLANEVPPAPEKTVRVNLALKPAVHKALKVWCVRNETLLPVAAAAMIESYLTRSAK